MVLDLRVGVARHFSESFKYEPVSEVYMLAGIAIPLFFMSSGFLMASKKTNLKYCAKKIWGVLKFTFIICLLVDFSCCFSDGFHWSYLRCFLQQGRLSVFWYFGSMICIYALLPAINFVFKRKYLKKVLLVLFVIEIFVFVSNCMWNFEHRVLQTFRLWNHTFYFVLGTFIFQNKDRLIALMNWKKALVCMILFLLSGKVLFLGGNEYHFSSPLCILYSMSVFLLCLKYVEKKNGFIETMSRCFLPVYAFHMIFFNFIFNTSIMHQLDVALKMAPIAFFVEFILVSAIIISFSVIVVRSPLINRMFRL